MKQVGLQGLKINIIIFYLCSLPGVRALSQYHLIIVRKVTIIFKIKLKTEPSNVPVLQNLVCFKTALGS